MSAAVAQRALEDVARVGVRRGAVGHHDVAEHPRGRRALAAPRQDLERRRVGLGEHVGLVDPGEALDRRAVEADALGEGALELGRRDRDRLQEAEHVGEPQPHEPDVALLERAEHEVFLLAHGASLGVSHRWLRRALHGWAQRWLRRALHGWAHRWLGRLHGWPPIVEALQAGLSGG